MNTKFISSTNLRSHFNAVIADVIAGNTAYCVTMHGKPVAWLVQPAIDATKLALPKETEDGR